MSAKTHLHQERPAERWVVSETREEFDRVAFALGLLRLVSPPSLRVAVYECSRQVRVERGRDLGRGPSAMWGTLGVSRYATREHIVLAVAELAGVKDLPFVVDLLAAQPEETLATLSS